MPGNRRKKRGKGPSGSAGGRRLSVPMATMDRRLMERFHRAIGRLTAGREFESPEAYAAFVEEARCSGKLNWENLAPGEDATPEDRAQELTYQAIEETSPKRRIGLAQEALRLWPDCVDALLLLAEESASSREEIETLFRRAVEAGERTLGEVMFREERGHFWGIPETRPYMRARASLAEWLWLTDRHSEAIAHWRGLLELNPCDNQGTRYDLLAALLLARRLDEAGTLLREYPDDAGCEWFYGKIVYHSLSNDPSAARRAANDALDRNPNVFEYFAGVKKLPARLPDAFAIGSAEEAQAYVAQNLKLWQSCPDAVKSLVEAALDHFRRDNSAS